MTTDSSACPERLAEKVAVVTGSTHGIGLSITKRFAREGASLVVNDHGEYDGKSIAAELEETDDGDAIYTEADVCDPDAVERLVESAVEEYGRIDVLVNNVGDGRTGPFTETTVDDWEFVMNVSLRSQWFCAKHAMEHIPAGGRIINISSTNAYGADLRMFPYNVAKAGVNGLTRALAVELGPLDITVNAIMPGLILVDTPNASTDELEQERKIDPAGRWGVPSDIAGLAAYLAADESAFVTGTSIPVDGGRYAVLLDDHYADWRANR